MDEQNEFNKDIVAIKKKSQTEILKLTELKNSIEILNTTLY